MRNIGLLLCVTLVACGGSGKGSGGGPDSGFPSVGGAVLISDQLAKGSTTGSAQASFPGAFLVPAAQGVIPGVMSQTTMYGQCVLSLPPACSMPCPSGTVCTGPDACGMLPQPTPSLNAGVITVTGAKTSPLSLTLQPGLGLYGSTAPTGPLLAASEMLHVVGSGGAFPAFAGYVVGINDLAVSQPAFPADGSPLPWPASGGLPFAWTAEPADMLAIQISALGPSWQALLDCRPADALGAYTVPQAALDALRAATASDAGAVTYPVAVRRFRVVTVATPGGPVELVAESVVEGSLAP